MEKYYILKCHYAERFLKGAEFGDGLFTDSEDKAMQFAVRKHAVDLQKTFDALELVEVIVFDDGEKWYA